MKIKVILNHIVDDNVRSFTYAIKKKRNLNYRLISCHYYPNIVFSDNSKKFERKKTWICDFEILALAELVNECDKNALERFNITRLDKNGFQ